MIVQAYELVGVPWILDANAGDVLGYCKDAQNTYDGKRHHAANSYKLGENVTIWYDALVEKVIFQGSRKKRQWESKLRVILVVGSLRRLTLLPESKF